MMKKILYLASIIVLFSCCKTDFNINGEWKDITVVYGILSQNNTTHYVKINKAFLGEGNALTMAQIPDSSSYGDNIEVTIEEWKNDNELKRTWVLKDTIIQNKEAGDFYYPNQELYTFTATLDANAEYRLFIKNKITGKIISAKTELIRNFSISNPMGSQQINLTSTTPYIVRWYSAEYGKRYEITIRFSYQEKNILTNDSTMKTLDWNLGIVKSEDTRENRNLSTSFTGTSFFKFIHDNIEANPTIVRKVSGIPLEFIFAVGADEFSTYLDVNAPSSGILQEKPEYTNISNGIGLFSSRYQISQKNFMNNVSRDSLFNGSFTKELNFY